MIPLDYESLGTVVVLVCEARETRDTLFYGVQETLRELPSSVLVTKLSFGVLVAQTSMTQEMLGEFSKNQMKLKRISRMKGTQKELASRVQVTQKELASKVQETQMVQAWLASRALMMLKD